MYLKGLESTNMDGAGWIYVRRVLVASVACYSLRVPLSSSLQKLDQMIREMS